MSNNAQRQWKLALVGNPNVGKSVVFQALTGIYAEVSNFPGTTVDMTCGDFGNLYVVDTPGVFSLSGFNDEEQVTIDALQDCDFILNIADGTQLSRDLFLTLQLLSLGKPMLLAVNLMDQVRKNGLRMNLIGLSDALGIPVFPISAKKGEGLDALKEAILLLPSASHAPEPASRPMNRCPASPRFPASPLRGSEDDYLRLRKEADELAARYVINNREEPDPFRPQGPSAWPDFSQSLGRAILNPIIGFPVLFVLLSSIFLFIGKFLSQTVVDFTEGVLMGEWYFHFIYPLIGGIIDPDSLAGVLLIGEYGILTMVPIYLFGLLLPLIIGFYLCLALLEDSGLLPRIAVLCDRLFMRFGLNGKAVIPMLLGFGCVTMALITTRILGTKRERLIASVLLCLAIPCSAQFAIILVVAGALPLHYFLIYAAIIGGIFCLTGVLLNRVLPGAGSDLFLVLPPLRLPGLRNILTKTAMKSKHFLKDAGPMFLLGSLLISLLSYTNGFAALYSLLLPVTQNLLGLPAEAVTLFVLSLIKRDLGAAYLYSLMAQGLFNFPQLTVALTVITLFVPCFASVAVLFKERGAVAACCIWIGSCLAALLTGGLLASLLGIA